MSEELVGHIQGLYFYPIKSCASVHSASLDLHPDIGVYGDRAIALVHPDTKRVLTQREYPQLARVTVNPDLIATRETLFLSMMVGEVPYHVEMPFAPYRDTKIECWVHKDAAIGYDIGSSIFFEKLLGFKPMCVLLDEKRPRVHHSTMLNRDVTLGYADSHPVLLTTTASLAAVNAALKHGGHAVVPMNRFRPNIVVQSILPWEEDSWQMIRIDKTVLEYAKPCNRCAMTTIDQVTGECRSKEPLQTLAKIRPARGGPLFGNYYVVREGGLITLDAPVEVLESRILQ